MSLSPNSNLSCPCGSGAAYQQCCGRFIEAGEIPSSPQALMRSRYSAYTLENIDYIRDTCTGEALAAFSYEDSLLWAKEAKWISLTVISAVPPSGGVGRVSFSVLFSQNGLTKRLEETSRFIVKDDRWYYEGGEKFRLVDVSNRQMKLGRNDPCYCGSGKKFKKCCANK